jgi:hypothetical protein
LHHTFCLLVVVVVANSTSPPQHRHWKRPPRHRNRHQTAPQAEPSAVDKRRPVPTAAGRRPPTRACCWLTKTRAVCACSRPTPAAAVEGRHLPQTANAYHHRPSWTAVAVFHRPHSTITHERIPTAMATRSGHGQPGSVASHRHRRRRGLGCRRGPRDPDCRACCRVAVWGERAAPPPSQGPHGHPERPSGGGASSSEGGRRGGGARQGRSYV